MHLRRKLLLVVLLTGLGLVQVPVPASAGGRAEAQQVALSGVVQTSGGAPIAGATVNIGEQQVLSDDQGQWQIAVDFAPRLRGFVSANGYVQRGYRELDLPSPNTRVSQLQDTLVSIFDPDADTYARQPGAPPTVTDFVTNAGVSRSQTLPSDTKTVTVTGTVGSRDGQPVVRDDAYLARPDDFVDPVQLAISGGAFTGAFPITHGPGVYRLEINDTTGGALINVPLFVGVAYQPEPPIWPDDADVSGDGPVSRALDALQQVRQTHGLQPYGIDQRLQKVAQDHVDDMLAANWFCHCWADGSSVLDHVRAAGIEPAHIPVPGHPNQYTFGVGNAIAGAPGAAAIRGLFASPGHRRDLLGSYTHIGIAYGGQIDDGTARLSIVYAVEQ
jgi:uncharacterized protein YkwD